MPVSRNRSAGGPVPPTVGDRRREPRRRAPGTGVARRAGGLATTADERQPSVRNGEEDDLLVLDLVVLV
jgi:hypothetical protein